MDHPPPPLRLHRRDDRPRQPHDGRQVDLDDAVPDLVLDRIDRLRRIHARVVHENVDRAEGLQRGDGEGVDGGAVLHVGDPVAHLGPFDAVGNFDGGGGKVFLVAAADHDPGSAFDETARDGLPQPLATAGDQGGPSPEIEQFALHPRTMHVDSVSASGRASFHLSLATHPTLYGAFMNSVLLIDPRDNLGVALRPLAPGETLTLGGREVVVSETIPPKQKFTLETMAPGDRARMYGVTVGVATETIPAGGLVTTANLKHEADGFSRQRSGTYSWTPPDVSHWKNRSFDGYHRADGSVGTANHWLVIPMVFCENRNVNAIRTAFERALGYERTTHYQKLAARLVEGHRAGADAATLRALSCDALEESATSRPFPNLDGVQFLTHTLGCGGTRDDAAALCGLLAGYITHPNVAGATVLSLGCENAQLELLEEAIRARAPRFDKPLLTFRQQAFPNEKALLETAIKETFLGLVEANRATRKPAALDRLCIGVECGGSDGFSGISANPTLGALSDRLVALGGRVILSEFPELCGVEQELVDRCVSDEVAARFTALTSAYAERARAVGSDFSQNPSPGNIRDGLITDAIKSAGAAKKGGTSPVVAALDYPEIASQPGLTLLCTPGGDVESTTAMAGAHANVILFTTGLGTPTGNPVCPVLKISTNTELAARLPDLIDFDTGPILRGEATLDELSERLFNLVVEVASGRVRTRAQTLGQNDFQPWKRGVSL